MSKISKKLRKTLAIVLAFAMVASVAVPSAPAQAAAKKYAKSLKVSPSKVTMTAGAKKTVKATVKVSGKAKKNVTVKSSNKGVVTVKTKKADKKGVSVITLTAKNVTSKKSAKITVTTSAKNKKGKKIKKTINVTVNPKASTGGKATPKPTAAAKKYTVTNVGAINTESGEVVLKFDSPVTAADLTGTTLTIKGENNTTVTATFSKVSADGNSATYVISSADLGKLTTGTYTITTGSASVVIPSTIGKTDAKVQIKGSSVKGFVYYNANPNGIHPDIITIPYAQVTIEGATVSADRDGFYQKAVDAGEKSNISVKAAGYFDESKEKVKVVNDRASSYNFEMERYDISKVYICGTVVDSADSQIPVKGATVVLYEDGKVKATLKTDDTGRYVFMNNNAEVKNFEVASTSQRRFSYSNNISKDKKYNIVISKDLSADNLDDVYTEVDTKTIDLGSARNVNIDTKMKKVANVGEITMKLSWTKDTNTVLKSDSTKVKVKFVDVDGETVLVNDKVIDLADYLNAQKDGMEKVYKLAAEDYFGTGTNVHPTLPSGTYYLIITDIGAGNAQVNATTVVPVEITEGGNKATEASIDPAVSRDVTYTVNKTDTYGETAYKKQGEVLKTVTDKDGTLGSANITVTAKVYQKVGGKNVLIYTNSGITLSKDNSTYAYQEGVKNLAANGNYVIETLKTHLTAGTGTIQAGNSDSVSINLRTAANVVKVKMKAASCFFDSETDDKVAVDTQKVMVNSVTVTGEAARGGNVTATAAINKEYTLKQLVNGIAVNKEELKGLEPGKYTVSFDIDGYKASSEEMQQDDEQDVIDLQDVTMECEATYNRVYPTTITGVIKPATTADNTELSAEGLAILYTSDLKKIVAANTLYKAANNNPAYKLEDGVNGTFGSGKYILVIRAKGMDILTKEITIDAANKIHKNQDIENVAAGGSSSFHIPITTTNGNPLNADADVQARDSYYRNPYDLSVVDIHAAACLVNNSAYDGKYALALAAGGVETWVLEKIPAATYKVSAQDYGITEYKEVERTLTTGGDNVEAIKVPLLVYDDLVRVQMIITNKNDSFAAKQIDFITVDSEDGSISRYGWTQRTKQKEEVVIFYVPKNKAYTVNVYSSGSCVEPKPMAAGTVENREIDITCPDIK